MIPSLSSAGRDQTDYFITALNHFDPKLLLAYSGFGESVPIHKFLLSNLVGGGWVAFSALTGAVIVMLSTSQRAATR